MPVVRHAATVYTTPGQLALLPGPSTSVRYAWVKSLNALFTWVKGDETTTNNRTVIGRSGGAVGTWQIVEGAGTYYAATDGVIVDSSASCVAEGFRDTNFTVNFLKHNADNSYRTQHRFSQAWDTTTAVAVAANVVGAAASTGSVYLSYAYAFAHVGSAVPAFSSWTTGAQSFSVASSQQYQPQVLSVVSITPPSYTTAQSQLLFTITRLGSSASDTYDKDKDHGTSTANFGIFGVTAKHLVGGPGSADSSP